MGSVGKEAVGNGPRVGSGGGLGAGSVLEVVSGWRGVPRGWDVRDILGALGGQSAGGGRAPGTAHARTNLDREGAKRLLGGAPATIGVAVGSLNV